MPLTKSPGPGRDAIRITDRFFGPQLRGFDIRGIGPRIVRNSYDIAGDLDTTTNQTSDSLGGRAYYMGRLELEVPVSSSIRSLGLAPVGIHRRRIGLVADPAGADRYHRGLRPGHRKHDAADVQHRPGGPVNTCGPTSGPTGFSRIAGIKETFLGNSPKPRLAIGVGVNWVSPFGPFRIDIAKALLSQEGDDTKLFSFNVGTQF